MKKGNSDEQSRQSFWRLLLKSVLVFWAFNIPFRLLMQILPYSEVRPSNAIPPILGILWGGAGALGTSLANVLVDVLVSHTPANVWIPGFGINFLYAYLPYRLWHAAGKSRKAGRIRKVEKGRLTERQDTLPKMDSVPEILKYCMIILTDSAVITPMLALTFALAGQNVDFSDVLFLFFNNFDFAILLGIPILIFHSFLRERRGGRKLTIGTRAVAGFMILSVLFAAALGIWTYVLLRSHTAYDSLQRWKLVYRVTGIGIHILFACTLLLLKYVESFITKPLNLLTVSMKKFAAADHLQHTASNEMKEICEQIRTGDELQILSEAFLKMTRDIAAYVKNLAAVTAEKEKISAELSVASHIQTDMLPNVFPAYPQRKEFQIYAAMYTAREVGGDFYDFFLVDENHLGFLMADVSGKGVPAALFMVVARTLLMNQAKQGEKPWDIFYHVNNQLCENNASGMFVTAWLGILELNTGQLLYSNAGHTRPLLGTRVGGFEWFPDTAHGFVLGGIEDMRFPSGTRVLEKGESLFLYTDGVTEANDQKGRMYGEERLLETLNNYREKPLKELLDGVKHELDGFAEGGQQFDDITMLALCYEGIRE